MHKPRSLKVLLALCCLHVTLGCSLGGSRTDRLFVLTAHQETFLLDVKKLQESFATPLARLLAKAISNQRHQVPHPIQVDVCGMRFAVMRANPKFTIAEIICALRAVCTSTSESPTITALRTRDPSSARIVFAPNGSASLWRTVSPVNRAEKLRKPQPFQNPHADCPPVCSSARPSGHREAVPASRALPDIPS